MSQHATHTTQYFEDAFEQDKVTQEYVRLTESYISLAQDEGSDYLSLGPQYTDEEQPRQGRFFQFCSTDTLKFFDFWGQEDDKVGVTNEDITWDMDVPLFLSYFANQGFNPVVGTDGSIIFYF